MPESDARSVVFDITQLARKLCAQLRSKIVVQELCESRRGSPGLSVLTSLLVSMDVTEAILNHASALIGLSLSLICQPTSEDIKQHYLPTYLAPVSVDVKHHVYLLTYLAPCPSLISLMVSVDVKHHRFTLLLT